MPFIYKQRMCPTKVRRLLRVVISLVVLVTASLLSRSFRHWTQKLIVKTEIGLAKLRGNEPMLVSIAGQLDIPGARVLAVDSRSGWATLCDREGRFVLPDVIWYPGASYDLIVSSHDCQGRRIRLTTARTEPAEGLISAGNLDLARGDPIDVAHTPGINFISYEDYDFQNRDYYRKLYSDLTSGILRDEGRVDAVNNYVAERLNYNETEWELGSPRRVVERHRLPWRPSALRRGP